jgi:hypothetical protein
MVAMQALTQHARIRMQQRGMSAAAVEDLLAFGREVHDHHGATIVYLDKRARARIAPQQIFKGKRLDLYAMVGSDGLIKTVGHRFQRIRRV